MRVREATTIVRPAADVDLDAQISISSRSAAEKIKIETDRNINKSGLTTCYLSRSNKRTPMSEYY